MKTYKNILTTAALIAFSMPLFSQEYDDLYFSAKDRKQVTYASGTVNVNSNESLNTYKSFTNNTYSSSYAKEVNPELIAKYQQDSRKSAYTDAQQYTDTNDAYYSSGYNDTYDRDDFDNPLYNRDARQNGQTVINNYYGNGFNNRWGNNRWMMNSMMGYNPWMGWNSGFSIGFGMGNFGFGGMGMGMGMMGFGNPWMNPFYDPFYGPMYGGMWGYDPFFMGGWGNPYMGGFGWGRPWGWNNRAWAYQRGFNDGFMVGSVASRHVVRGGRVVRGAGMYTNGVTTRTTGYRNAADVRSANNAGRTPNVVSGTNARTRDYSNTQNEYYNRSRVANSTNNTNSRIANTERPAVNNSRVATPTSTNSRTVTNPNSNGSRYNTPSPNTNSRTVNPGTNNTYNRSGNTSTPTRTNVQPSSDNQRRYNTVPNNSTYTAPRNNSNNTYSAPSRSNNTYSAPSRSNSGGSGSYSAPSRGNSGGSYSAPSRSSGSSSGGSRRGG